MDVENQRLLFDGGDLKPTALQNNLAFFYKDCKPIGFVYQASPKGCYLCSKDLDIWLFKTPSGVASALQSIMFCHK